MRDKDAVLPQTGTKGQPYLIVVDQDDRVIGYQTKDKCHEKEGIMHRAFSIFIFNDKRELLLQRRSEKKKLWPLYWSNSVCSHPNKGESCAQAALRRLKEELGLSASLRELFRFTYHACFEDIGSEREMCAVYIGRSSGQFAINKDEISECKFVGIEELTEDIRLNPQKYTPWFKIEWERINKSYRGEIEELYSKHVL